jgi:hypothetical protein
MPDLPADELRRMAQAIDAGLEPRVRVDLDLSAEGAERLRDVLAVVSADLLIENSWPLLRMAEALDAALAAG